MLCISNYPLTKLNLQPLGSRFESWLRRLSNEKSYFFIISSSEGRLITALRFYEVSDPASLFEHVDDDVENGSHKHRPDRVVELPLINPPLDLHLLLLFFFFIFCFVSFFQ